MINGKNDSGGRIVAAMHNLLDDCFISPWFERVNTAWILSDLPARSGARAAIDFSGLARVAELRGDVPPCESA